MNHSEITSFLWGVADLIRDTFKRGKYQDVILPLTVLRRIDQVLQPTKAKVLSTYAEYRDQLDNPDRLLRSAAGYAFYNTSPYDFEKLLDDPPALAANLRSYIQAFSPNMREVIEKFDFDNTITKLDDEGLLFQVMERFGNVDLHPDRVPNPMMGTIFENLIRKFNEALNENPGEHFTPRDVVRLMARLLTKGDEERIEREHAIFTVHDPCSGTGGMLTITKDVIQGSPDQPGLNPTADVFLFGQEVNPETFAI
ncbi:MAG: type I restriction-modification system subunit M N-terminal domain-containing protein, partial [Longimicrobiales bacterium]